jgi:hypothetical protein
MFLLLTIAIPVLTLRSNDLCGMSIHQTDSPELPGFQSIEVGWTVPQLFIRPSESGTRSPLVAQEIALCCGDDCSSRLSAGILTKMGSTGKGSTSDLVLQFSPHHNPIQIDLPLGVGAYMLSSISDKLLTHFVFVDRDHQLRYHSDSAGQTLGNPRTCVSLRQSLRRPWRNSDLSPTIENTQNT